MKALIQRALSASVNIDGEEYSKIDKGLLVFLGVEKEDSEQNVDKLVKKISELRIFQDEQGKMNLSIVDVKASLLLVSQFTLAGDLSRGKRPSFDTAAKPELANKLYEYAIESFKNKDIPTSTGVFAADMKIALVNDGPVSFHLDI